LFDLKVYGLDKFPEDKKIPLAGILYSKDKKEATLSEIEHILKTIYCGPVGVEFSHLEVKASYLFFVSLNLFSRCVI